MSDDEIVTARDTHYALNTIVAAGALRRVADEALARGAEIARLKTDLATCQDHADVQADRLRERVAQLETALRFHGHHTTGCATHTAGTWMHVDANECGCGLRVALVVEKPGSPT